MEIKFISKINLICPFEQAHLITKLKTVNMSRFALEFSFKYLENSLLIKKTKYWNGNSMAKSAKI